MSRALGLDVGDVRIGVALSDPGRVIAQAWDTVRNDKQAIETIARLVEAEEVGAVVVGWPLTLEGQVGRQAQKVERFRAALEARLGFPVGRYDERLTTVAAARALSRAGLDERRRRAVVDKVAAALILQGWLDSR